MPGIVLSARKTGEMSGELPPEPPAYGVFLNSDNRSE
jgi:hypothetical protein